MITEKMLYDAAKIAGDALATSLPEPNEIEYTFSKRFERKMNRLIRRTKHVTFYKMLKLAACILLAATIGFGVTLAFNTEVRAAFIGWIKKQYEIFVDYYFVGESDEFVSKESTTENIEYRLGWVPEGYSETFRSMYAKDYFVILYQNSNKTIQFHYSTNPDALNLLYEKSSLIHSSTYVNDMPADLYMSTVPDIANVIVWTSSDNHTIFSISAFSDIEELVNMSENIIEMEN